MFDVRFKGLRIEVTLAAGRESVSENIDLNDIAEILENGYDCGTGKRKEGTVERCLRRGNKVFKAVVVQTSVRYSDGFQEDVWRLIHVGKFTYSRKHKQKGDGNEA